MTRRSLVGAWCPSLGATGFRLLDRSGRGNHGTLTNMASTAWTTSGGKGSLSFDGSNAAANRVDCGRLPYLENASALTFSFWSKWANNANARAGFFSYSQSGQFANDIFFFNESSNYKIQINNGSDGARVCFGAAPSKALHFCVVYDGGASEKVTLSIDGTQQTLLGAFSYPATTSAGSASHQFWIGGYAAFSTGFFLNGTIDDFRIYNRALTPPEIRQLYVGGRGFGLIPERPRHRSKTAAAGFKAYWARRQSQLIGGGL